MLYKRGKSKWWCSFYIGGVEIRKSTRTRIRAEAEEFEIKLRHSLWRQTALNEPPDYIWEDACAAWLEENRHKRSLEKDKSIIRWTLPHIQGRKLKSLTGEDLANLRNAKAQETSPSNANRTMALIRAVLKRAFEMGMTLNVPKVKMFHQEQPEPMWITRDQFAALVKNLKPLQAEVARFAVSTGLRRTNVTHLKWEQVDLKRRCCWVSGKNAKGKKAIPVPLGPSAMAVLNRQQGQHPVWVFPYDGKPLVQTSTRAWRAAVIKAGIPGGFRFHDLRHTWASWHIQAGTSMRELQELGGWSSAAMVQRYAHLNPSHLAEAANRLDIEPVQKHVQS